MSNTKENILLTALRLFAQDGYKAVSVSTIANELGMTKGALYKHYKNKQDIFDCIVERIYKVDVEHAKKCEVPEETFDKSPLPYSHTSIENIKVFIKEKFCFWIEDEFACNFRKILVLEQYRNTEIADLYHKCLTSGPVSYMEDIFREMMEQGILEKNNPKQLAIDFYSPFYLLISISDSVDDKEEVKNLLNEHVEQFIIRNTVKNKKEKE